jgi:hypothetical protein
VSVQGAGPGQPEEEALTVDAETGARLAIAGIKQVRLLTERFRIELLTRSYRMLEVLRERKT